MKNKLFYLLVIIIAIFSLWLITDKRVNNKSDGKIVDNQQLKTLKIGNKTILIEVVATEKERENGLSNRPSLPTDTGMLFVFDQPAIYHFWMKEMNFPIDIVWLDENYKVVDLSKDLKPETYPKTFSSQAPVLYVLELNAGKINELNIKIGDILMFNI